LDFQKFEILIDGKVLMISVCYLTIDLLLVGSVCSVISQEGYTSPF